MNYEQAKETLINHIKCYDLHSLPGFDIYYDTSWYGHRSVEIKVESETDELNYLYFEGDVEFNIDLDGNPCDVKTFNVDAFELFDNEGETITNFML